MLILLGCPRCQKNLVGENNSKVFFCLDCGLGFDVSENPPKHFGLFFTDPRIQKDHPSVYFPVWKISSEYKIIYKNHEPTQSSLRFFYVTAFFIKNIDYFGDIGYYFTVNNIQLTPGRRRNFPVFPADRGFQDVIGYPRIFLSTEASNKKRRFLDIHIDHKDISIGLVPFYRMNSDCYDSIIFWKYPSGALI